MQGITAIRWSSSVLTAITLHTVCWFWADQILPPAIGANQPPHRLTITLATNNNTQQAITPVAQEPLPQPTVPPTSLEKKLLEPPVQSASISSQKSPKLKVQDTLKPSVDIIQIRPKWKPQAPARKQEPKVSSTEEKTLQISAPETSTTTPPPSPVPAVKTDVPETKKIHSVATSKSIEKTLPLRANNAQQQALASAPPQTTPTFKNLPLVIQPVFSKPPNPPQYPRRAKRKRLQGQVILRARVDDQGLVEHIVIWQSSGHRLLDKAAEKAMWDWQFTPAKQAGIRTASWVEFPVNFAIR